MNFFNVVSLFGGLALFLYGMRIMGDGLQKGSSGALKNAMGKVTNNPVVSFLLGLCVTGVIQSSTATIVLTSGLVGAGIITLHQSLGIILGANVGTTVTGQIIRLLDLNSNATAWLELFKPSTLAPLAAIVGILLIMAFKFHNADLIGNTAMGFSILFTGLLNMTAAVAPLSESPAFSQLFIALADKPMLGFLAGAVVAFIIQSSSATVGILQALALTGKLSFSSVYAVIIGIYMGDCITTAIVCSLGSKADAKRTGIVHILFNLCGVALVAGSVALFHKLGLLDTLWSRPITSGGIANTHTLFKMACAVLLLPFVTLLEKASRKIIKDDPAPRRDEEPETATLDKTFLDSPALALEGVQLALTKMARMAVDNTKEAMENLLQPQDGAAETIRQRESSIDRIADQISDYLVRLSPRVGDDESEKINYYIKCVTEFERIGDHAINLVESAEELEERGVHFSSGANRELGVIKEALHQVMDYAFLAYHEQSVDSAFHVEPLEEVIDELVATLRSNHILRLRRGQCNVESGFVFLDVLGNLERISDQCSNIGVHTVTAYGHETYSEHDYIRYLHEGHDERYSKEYKSVYEEYFSRLRDAAAPVGAE
ncbi:MAG: Na/Pi cotransporter family protein [Oscillospiraceae bacterium]|nr:Na/Pi cotransporter family protein [Oscillospiraceae bacterium]